MKINETQPRHVAQRVVAEMSKNWLEMSDSTQAEPHALLSRQFENVIAHNAKRGFELESWQYQATAVALSSGNTSRSGLNETIIAVFREATS